MFRKSVVHGWLGYNQTNVSTYHSLPSLQFALKIICWSSSCVTAVDFMSDCVHLQAVYRCISSGSQFCRRARQLPEATGDSATDVPQDVLPNPAAQVTTRVVYPWVPQHDRESRSHSNLNGLL